MRAEQAFAHKWYVPSPKEGWMPVPDPDFGTGMGAPLSPERYQGWIVNDIMGDIE